MEKEGSQIVLGTPVGHPCLTSFEKWAGGEAIDWAPGDPAWFRAESGRYAVEIAGPRCEHPDAPGRPGYEIVFVGEGGCRNFVFAAQLYPRLKAD